LIARKGAKAAKSGCDYSAAGCEHVDFDTAAYSINVLAPGGGPNVGFDTPQGFAMPQTATQPKRLLNQRLARRLNSYERISLAFLREHRELLSLL
jgi:hypothetical protein